MCPKQAKQGTIEQRQPECESAGCGLWSGGDLCFAGHQLNCDSLDIVVIVIADPAPVGAGIESVMADKAFALSPISARPSLPSEEDYEAIREAFRETSRGRWFLGEYARRNRNADTT